ncbi:ATP-binding protein [Roseofilum sp. BLCC_M91]|uniref:histidine kinase n=1 Tax=Roseofilum halophilum BLCC-M91 TaxID=3022259 RepID=A0ABT7BQ78_9CYAN|nr:ATP-binding protein [Roseofilum halophilum]MDJ1181344.1 ATP-binding protein [Roseofilum halophilum BLCC-M91]
MIASENPSNFWTKNLLFRTYSKLPLQQKISVPFVCVFLGLWILGTVGIGYYFLKHLEKRQLAELQSVSALMLQQFHNETEKLRLNTKLAVESEKVRQGVEDANTTILLQHLLPLKLLLELDLVQVIDVGGKSLVNLKLNSLSDSKINNEMPVSQSMNGVSISTIINAENENENENDRSILISTAPIKSNQGIIGGVIIGRVMNYNFLNGLTEQINESIVVFQNNKIIASSLLGAENFVWLPPSENSVNNFHQSIVKIGDRSYLGRTVPISGINQSQLQLVILAPLDSLEKAKRNFLIGLVVFCLVGSVIAILVGYFVSSLIALRIRSVTKATEQLANDDLWVKLPVLYNDELDRLSKSFNRMAKKLKNRDEALKIKVEELEETLEKLYLTESQLIQSEKMSSLGQMVAGIAHEFNNPVNFIYANIEPAIHYVDDLLYLIDIYQKEYPSQTDNIAAALSDIDFDFLAQDFLHLLTSIKAGAERISVIVRGLRTFSRLDETGIKKVNLHENIESTLLILQHKMQEQIQEGKILKREIYLVENYADLPWIICDPSQLNQVFLSLIDNAIYALDELRQDTENAKLPQIVLKTECGDRSSVKITISDNGCGMSEEVKNKIFDPFFTTKPVGSGTGLGLSISYSIIVDRCGGKLKCHSIPGEGTEFIIELPLEGSGGSNC